MVASDLDACDKCLDMSTLHVICDIHPFGSQLQSMHKTLLTTHMDYNTKYSIQILKPTDFIFPKYNQNDRPNNKATSRFDRYAFVLFISTSITFALGGIIYFQQIIAYHSKAVLYKKLLKW
eukprot:643225_1